MSPSSILVPENTTAIFQCIAHCVQVCQAIWYIRDISAANPDARTLLIQEGFSFPYSPPTSGTYRTIISVNASTSINNTRIWCFVENVGRASGHEYDTSDIAMLKVLSGIIFKTKYM